MSAIKANPLAHIFFVCALILLVISSPKVDNKELLSNHEFVVFSALRGESDACDKVSEIANLAKQQCEGKEKWPEIKILMHG